MNTRPSRSANGLPGGYSSWMVRQHEHARVGRELRQQLLLERRHDERHVGLADERQLLVALGARRRARQRVAFELRLPLGAQEVEVDGVEHDERLGRERAHRIDVLDRDVVARHHDDVELAAALRQQVGDRAHVRVEQHLDAALLQLRHVRLAMLEVVGDERDLAAKRGQDLEDREHAHRPRVVVGRQHAGVDHEHAQLGPAVALEFGVDAVARDAWRARTPTCARTCPG